jgi:shikimate dehydrogenase
MKHGYRFGLIGHRVSYSKSGDVFRAIFSHIGKEGAFDIFDVAPGDFQAQLVELVKDGVQGLSVTIPYKQAVMEYLQETDTIARALEAVNSVSIDSGALCGFNTDCYGFSLPLGKYGEKLKHGTALILGCGGAARAAVYSLYTDYELRRFTVLGRKGLKLTEFRRSLERHLHQAKITPVVEQEARSRDWERASYDIVVNGTPLGGWNYPNEHPLPKELRWRAGKIYYDINYNEGNNVVKSARDAGLIVIDGSAMLVGQALRSFDIWTGETVPFGPVYERVFGGMIASG